MHDGPVAGCQFHGTRPFVLLEAGIDDKVLVLDRALRRHLDGSIPNGNNEVGFSGQLPSPW